MEFASPDQWISEDSYVRFIDTWTDQVATEIIADHRKAISETAKASGLKTASTDYGRKPYNPASLMKLYIYGNINKIRSSRKLARECRINLEVRWLLSGVEPDFRTISDFRKDYKNELPKLFLLFNDFLRNELSQETGKQIIGGGFYSIDGTKIRANNAKDRCFTAPKILDRIHNCNDRIAQYEQYLREMDERDASDDADEDPDPQSLSKEELEEKINAYKKRLEKYLSIQKRIDGSGNQVALTDPDCRMMRTMNNGVAPCYNIQAAVDSENHIITDMKTTNCCTDHGLMNETIQQSLGKDPREIIEIAADNGYKQNDDIVECLKNGIIPNVMGQTEIDENGHKIIANSYDIEVKYTEATISDAEIQSTRPDDISKCLGAGVVPKCYEGSLTRIEGIAIKTILDDAAIDEEAKRIDSMSVEEKIDLAKKGCFVRDMERNCVYCPCGGTLFRKSTKKNGSIRYCNKTACKRCLCKCFSNTSQVTKWKEIDFGPGQRLKHQQGRPKAGKRTSKTEKIKIVKYRFKPDQNKLNQRKCLSEHPFGTIKRWRGIDHFLLCGLQKVNAEASMAFLGYNITRVLNMFSFTQLMNAVARL